MKKQTKLIREQAYSFELSARTVENAAYKGMKMLADLRQDGEHPYVIYQENIWATNAAGHGTRLAIQMLPSIVLWAFACELYLKALLSYEGKPRLNDHNLERLFLACSADMQKTIRTSVCSHSISEEEFPRMLADNAKIFQEFRYIHETSDTKQGTPEFFRVMVQAIVAILDDAND